MINLTKMQVEASMNEVLHARYSNSKLERTLCLDLLQWGEVQNDLYVQAFAHTYLGDYYIGVNDSVQCYPHLMKAYDISVEHDYDDLLVRIYSLLGFYYNTIADEQSSLEYYIDGIMICREVGDVASEGLIFNNIGYSLQRHKGYAQALNYYLKAYDLIQSCEEPSEILGILLNNLATVSILLHQLDEAKKYILSCEKVCYGTEQYDIFRSQTWCQYYVALNQPEEAIYWANHILLYEADNGESQHYTFDVYTMLFDSMIKISNREYAQKFLSLMEKYCAHNSFEQRQQLEIRLMSICEAFPSDEIQRKKAYKQYAVNTQELDAISNTIITGGLKDAIRFLTIAKQKEQLKTEKGSLNTKINMDELTRVYTRKYLDTLMNKFANHTLNSLGFIMVDVDCLKEYNDTYGHVLGDQALRYVGRLLNRYKNKDIFPCRFGGDEFVCLCINCRDEDIITYISSIRNDLKHKHMEHKTSRCATRITLSIGYCNATTFDNMQDIFQGADQALYHSKLSGRNTFSKHTL